MNSRNPLADLLLISVMLFLMCLPPLAQAITLKLATIAPDGSYWMTMFRKSAKQIKKDTGGRVKLKFYPSGIMGNQDTVLRKMRIGQLHGGAFTSGALGGLYPDSQIYSLPLVFKSLNEVDYVRQHMDQQIIAGFDKAGMVTFGLSEGGLAYAMSSQPITSASDLLERKIWAPSNNKNVELTLEAFDVTPISLAISDVLIGLQTSLIDTVATSPTAAIALQWHTQIKYITDIPFIYFYSLVAIDKKYFNRISAKDQIIVSNILSETVTKIDKQNRKDNSAALLALQNQGITLIKPDDATRQQWYTKGEIAIDHVFQKGDISQQFFDQLMAHIDTFRAQQAKF